MTEITPEFLAASGPLTPEETLHALKIDYRREADGTLVVPGSIDFSYKGLKKLPNLTGVVVMEHFFCFNNELTSLEGAPAAVGIRCTVSNNRLTSLKGAPRTVGEDFWCDNHCLKSLEGAPEHVGDTFGCQNARELTNLEHAPRTFKRIQTRFGEFMSWKDVPDRLAPETKARYQRENEEALVNSVIVLPAAVRVHAPLRLRNL